MIAVGALLVVVGVLVLACGTVTIEVGDRYAAGFLIGLGGVVLISLGVTALVEVVAGVAR